MRQSDATIVISESERDIVQRDWPDIRVVAIPYAAGDSRFGRALSPAPRHRVYRRLPVRSEHRCHQLLCNRDLAADSASGA